VTNAIFLKDLLFYCWERKEHNVLFFGIEFATINKLAVGNCMSKIWQWNGYIV
jgi:hypothetical protein